MRESSSDFRDALLELMETSPNPADHPSPDLWLAYQRGELPAAEEARLQEHLARCRDCFDLAGAAAAFAQPDDGQEVETAALWRLLRPQLDLPPGNVREISTRPWRRPWTFSLPSTLAASFFVMLVGTTVWNLRLQSSQASRAPRPNVPVVAFSGDERPASQQSDEENLTECTGPCVLELHTSEDLPVYRLALRDEATDRELWSCELTPDEDLPLTVLLPEGIEPGLHRLELSDGAGGRAGRVLETYLVRVPEPDGRD